MCQFKHRLIEFCTVKKHLWCHSAVPLEFCCIYSPFTWAFEEKKSSVTYLVFIHPLFISLVTCAIAIFWDNQQGNRNIDTSDLLHSDKFSQILNVCHNQSIFLTARVLTRETALIIYLFFPLCVGVWVDVYVCAGLCGSCGGWKKVLDLLELVLQSFGSPLPWMLGTRLQMVSYHSHQRVSDELILKISFFN